VDCGIFQGEKFAPEKNLEDFHFKPGEIEFVLLTHAHMDHCDRLPKLYKDGLRGKIYCTEATRDLTNIMLIDAAGIIAREAMAHGHEALYTEDDVQNLLALFETVSYDEQKNISETTRVTFRDAGHILGSAFLEVVVKDKELEKKIVFSGDLGNSPSPIIRDLEFASGADCVVVESTYAGVTHETKEEGVEKIRQVIVDTISDNGVLMIPVFVIEKTQEILFELNHLIENKEIPNIPVFLDSPLAIKAMEIYKDYENLFNQSSKNLIKAGDDIFSFPGLKFTLTRDESIAINHVPAPKVILASSGMCVGGRIPHHLKVNLSNYHNHVLFVAYQSPGSLGRKILQGDKEVFIDKEMVEVKAKISLVNSFSSHADEPHILQWVRKINNPGPRHLFINHGEEKNSLALAEKIKLDSRAEVIVPELGMVYEI
jgi:metallo-beta-lactamase family protein